MKLFAFDTTFKSESSKINIDKLSRMMGGKGVVTSNKKYLYVTPNQISDPGKKTLHVSANVVITIGNSIYKTVATDLTEANLGLPGTGAKPVYQEVLYNLRQIYTETTGDEPHSYPTINRTAFQEGYDYYVFACDPTSGDDSTDADLTYIITTPCIAPYGYTTSNSKCIGGFHYGRYRILTTLSSMFSSSIFTSSDGSNTLPVPLNYTGSALGGDWYRCVYVGIIPNSVWTLLHRPKCDPDGMAYIDGNIWGDIYLTSYDGYREHGALSMKGLPVLYPTNDTDITTSGATNWYGIQELAAIVGKRLPSYAEYIRGALSTPNQAAYGYMSNLTDADRLKYPKTTGVSPYLVSAYNIRDLVQVAWIWCSDIFDCETAVSCAWKSVNNAMKLGGMAPTVSCGDCYIPLATSVRALCAGGPRTSGVIDTSANTDWINGITYYIEAALADTDVIPTPGFLACTPMNIPWLANSHGYSAVAGWLVCDSID